MGNRRKILGEKRIQIIIDRLSRELIENHQDFQKTVLIGVQPRGTLLCNRISERLKHFLNKEELQSGALDISFFRDDFRRREEPIHPQSIDMDYSIESKKIVLIDDVLYTGRSIRAAIDALMTFGRPDSVELLTLIDRRFSRHLPIQANYVGLSVDVIDGERVIVEWQETHKKDQVIMRKPIS